MPNRNERITQSVSNTSESHGERQQNRQESSETQPVFEKSHLEIAVHLDNLDRDNRIEFYKESFQKAFEIAGDPSRREGFRYTQNFNIHELSADQVPSEVVEPKEGEVQLFRTDVIDGYTRFMIRLPNGEDGPSSRTMIYMLCKTDKNGKPIHEGATYTLSTEAELNRAIHDMKGETGKTRRNQVRQEALKFPKKRGLSEFEKNQAMRRGLITGSITGGEMLTGFRRTYGDSYFEFSRKRDHARRNRQEFRGEKLNEDETEKYLRNNFREEREKFIDQMFGERLQEIRDQNEERTEQVTRRVEEEVRQVEQPRNVEQSTQQENERNLSEMYSNINELMGHINNMMAQLETYRRNGNGSSHEVEMLPEAWLKSLEQAVLSNAIAGIETTVSSLRKEIEQLRGEIRTLYQEKVNTDEKQTETTNIPEEAKPETVQTINPEHPDVPSNSTVEEISLDDDLENMKLEGITSILDANVFIANWINSRVFSESGSVTRTELQDVVDKALSNIEADPDVIEDEKARIVGLYSYILDAQDTEQTNTENSEQSLPQVARRFAGLKLATVILERLNREIT